MLHWEYKSVKPGTSVWEQGLLEALQPLSCLTINNQCKQTRSWRSFLQGKLLRAGTPTHSSRRDVPTWWAERCRELSAAAAWLSSSPGTRAGWRKGPGWRGIYPSRSTPPTPPEPRGCPGACRTESGAATSKDGKQEGRQIFKALIKTSIYVIIKGAGLTFVNLRDDCI